MGAPGDQKTEVSEKKTAKPEMQTLNLEAIRAAYDKNPPHLSPIEIPEKNAWQPDKGGDLIFSVTSGGLERKYTTHFPPGYHSGKPMPVIFAMEGAAGGGNLAELSKLNMWADKEGFIVVYPHALKDQQGVTTWHGMYTNLLADARMIDDGRFIGQDMLKDLKNRGIKIEGKPFLYGFSQGGDMANEIQFRYPKAFGGIALVSAPKSSAQPEITRPGAATGPVYIYYSDKDYPYGNLEPGSAAFLAREGARQAIGATYQNSFPETVDYHVRNGGYFQYQQPEAKPDSGITVFHLRNAQGQEMRVVHYYGPIGGHAIPGQPAKFDWEGFGEGSRIPENSTMQIIKMFKAENARLKSSRK